ncbi:MAG: thioredoxin domain-containing protein [Gemmatimonadota bacterium]
MKKFSSRARGIVRNAAALALAATLVAVPGAVRAQQDSLVQRALRSRALGSDSARLTVYEVADFECPYCAEFTRTVEPELDSAYVATGKVKWVFVNLPLHTHRLGWAAAEAAMCAGGVADKFWPMHDLLYANQAQWASKDDPMPLFETYAQKAGVPLDAFRDCVLRDRVATLLLQDVTSVVGAQITGTPTFIVIKGENVVKRMVGVKPFSEWRQVLDAELGGS